MRPLPIPLLLAAALAAAVVASGAAAGAGLPLLVDNLAQGLEDPGSSPRDFFRLAEAVLFIADDGAHGPEIWVSDGTANGTRLLADLDPGPVGLLHGFVGGDPGRALFTEIEGCRLRLGSTDGTPEGTRIVTPPGLVWPAHQSISRSCRLADGLDAYAAATGRYYFFARLPSRPGLELWVSDGTAAGTRRVQESGTPAEGRELHGLAATVAGRVFFLSGNVSSNAPVGLWVSDGSAAGTRQAARIALAFPRLTDWAPLRPLTTFGDGVIFFASDAEHGSEPWVSDGTAAGTSPLADIVPGPQGSAVDDRFFVAPEGVYFLAAAAGAGVELWLSDGSAAGTRPVTDFATAAPLPLTDLPPHLPMFAAGGRTLFAADDGVHGVELWATDGSLAGTGLVADLCPGPCGSSPKPAGEVAGRVFFSADDGVHGRELWTTDGTPGGTGLAADLCPGPCDAGPAEPYRPLPALLGSVAAGILVASEDGGGGSRLWALRDGSAPLPLTAGGEVGSTGAVFRGALLFAADSGSGGREPWRSDGTPEGTSRLRDVAPPRERGSAPRQIVELGGELFFLADDGVHGRELWVSDGGAGGARRLSDFPDSGPYDARILPYRLIAAEDRLYLWVVDPHSLTFGDLWVWDGAAPEPRPLLTGEPIGQELAALGGRLFFTAGEELWVSDGTAAGTTRLQRFPQNLPSGLTPLGDEVFFIGPSQALWASDGTTGGTVPVIASIRVDAMVGLGDQLLLAATDGVHGLELWASDGTAAGTRLVADLAPGPESAFPRHLTPVDDRLFFTADRGGVGSIWASDGTPAGTRRLRNLEFDFIFGPQFTGVGETVFFLGEEPRGERRRGLWASDGSARGTRLVRRLEVRADGREPAWLTAAGDRLLLTASDGAAGFELWQSDGSEAGTRMVADLFPGPDSSAPGELTPFAGRVYFAAGDGLSGRELWAVDPDGAGGPCVPRSDSLCLHDGRIRVRARWLNPRRQGMEGEGFAIPLSSQAGTFWFFDPARVELLVKVLDGGPVNGFLWTFYGALTDLESWLEVADLASGAGRTYHHPPGDLCGGADVHSLPAVPALPPRAPETASMPLRPPGSVCPAGRGSLCLLGERFRVEVAWRDPESGAAGRGRAVTATEESGLFSFATTASLELAVKLVDGRAVNGSVWVVWGAATDLEYDLRVTDLETGRSRSYHHPAGDLCGGADVRAFP